MKTPFFLESNIKTITNITQTKQWFKYIGPFNKDGFVAKYLKNPEVFFKSAALDCKRYLTAGVTNGRIVEFVTRFNVYTSKSHCTDEVYNGQYNSFYQENFEYFNGPGKTNEVFKSMLKQVYNTIKQFSTTKYLKEINLMAYLQDITSYGGYMGDDFEKSLPLVVQGLKKNKIKYDAKTVFNFKEGIINIRSSKILNTLGFSIVETNRYNITISVELNNITYELCSYESGNSYGRY